MNWVMKDKEYLFLFLSVVAQIEGGSKIKIDMRIFYV